MLAVAATCLVAALVAAPTAGAASAGNAKAKAAQKAKASVTKKRLARDIRTVRRRTNAARRTLRTLGQTLAALQGTVNGVKAAGEGTQGQLNGVIAAVPQVLDALTQLRDGSLALKAGLETLAAKTTEGFNTVSAGFDTVEAALTDIGDFLGATEYGFGQVIVLQPAAAPQAGSFIVTPDIPDTVQQAMTHQTFVAQHTGNLGVLYGVRSGENDGTGAENPAAHCRVRVTNEAGATETTAANAGLGGAPFQAVPEKSTLTSTNPNNAAFPFGLKTNDNDAGEADNTTTFVSGVPVTAGQTYEVELSCVDVSADADDPEA